MPIGTINMPDDDFDAKQEMRSARIAAIAPFLHRDAAMAALSGATGRYPHRMTEVEFRTVASNAIGIADEFIRQYNPDAVIAEVEG